MPLLVDDECPSTASSNVYAEEVNDRSPYLWAKTTKRKPD
jgi:hypothetical protein